jgi:surfeit locus 1 family protein
MSVLILFSRQWVKTTILAIIAIAVMARLGIWQLDRLEQRKAFNARVETQLEQPILDLTADNIPNGLENMEYRSVIVKGNFEPAHQVVLRNQAWESRLGVHLLTPLRIENGENMVLIDRGWIPFEDFTNGELAKFDERREVVVEGMVRRSQSKAEIGGRTDILPALDEEPLLAWNLVNVEGIAAQTPYSFLPVYIQQAPDPQWTDLPYRALPDLELTEGPHLGYAIQWFIFGAILAVGYPLYIRREETAYKQAAKVSSRRIIPVEANSLISDNKPNDGQTRI